MPRRWSMSEPNAFSMRRAISGVSAALPCSRSESVARRTFKISAAFDTLSPRASMTSVLIRSPGCGGFFIGISFSLVVIDQVNVRLYRTRVKRRAARCFGVALAKKAREARDGEIGLKEFLLDVEGARDGFGGEIAAADRAFHGGGPAGGGPIAGDEKTGRLGILRGAPIVDAGLGGKRCGGFLDDRGFDELRFAGGG